MEESYYLGIDVSKGYADFVILDSKKHPVCESFQLDDTFDGHCGLYSYLETFYKHHPGAKIRAALESTGGYENNWFHALLKFQSFFDLETAHLNPLGVYANSRADMKRIVTDKISARSIAEFLISHPEKVSYHRQAYLSGLRKQWGFIKMLTKQKTQLLNQLESLLYSANPELLVYCKDGKADWVLKLLIRYPTAARLARARVTSVAKIPYVSLERAKELINDAKKSVASSTDAATGQLITATVKQILDLKKVITSQSKIMARDCSLPEVALLKTFPGISDSSAVGLMLQIQSIERFPSVKKLAAFFGLHPVFKTSGDGSSGFRMSKQGNKEVRRILFMIVLNAILCNPVIRDLYQERVQKGMNKMAAIGLCMHKTLRIIYGMLKHNRAFDSQIDRKNRERGFKVLRNAGPNPHKRIRRYQGFDPKAPISRRQKRKRKEWEQASQSVQNTQCGITPPIPLTS